MTYNTEGIILRYRDIGEYDRIYSILTREHGKVEAWAQGVRKPQSKLVAHLQPLYLCDFMIARGRRFDRIAQVRVLNRWASIWGDLERLGEAIYAASLVDMVVRPGAREKGVFELLLGYLEAGPPGNRRPGLALLTLFSLKLLKESGFAPELRNCVLCKAAVEGLTRHLDAIRGGVVCDKCVLPPPLTPPPAGGENDRFPPLPEGRLGGVGAFPISSLTIETLEEVLGAPFAALEVPETVRRELDQIAQAMIRAHFGEEPKARMFVETLAKEVYNPVAT